MILTRLINWKYFFSQHHKNNCCKTVHVSMHMQAISLCRVEGIFDIHTTYICICTYIQHRCKICKKLKKWSLTLRELCSKWCYLDLDVMIYLSVFLLTSNKLYIIWMYKLCSSFFEFYSLQLITASSVSSA